MSRLARWSYLLISLLAVGARPVSAGPRALASPSLGLIGPDVMHADLALTSDAMYASPTVSLLTTGGLPSVVAAPLPAAPRAIAPISGATTVGLIAPVGRVMSPAPAAPADGAKESSLKKQARARRAAARKAAEGEPAHAGHKRSARRVANEDEPEVRSAAATRPQLAARRPQRLFDPEEHSPFEEREEVVHEGFHDRRDDGPHHDRVSIRGEALWLERDSAANITLASSVTAAGGPDGRAVLPLNSVQNFDDAGGFRTSVIYRFNPHDALEVAYFGSQTWQNTASITGIAGSNIQSNFLGLTIATPDESFAGGVIAQYMSQVHNGELNWIRAYDDVPSADARYMLGLRIFTFRDDLLLSGTTSAAGVSERTREVTTNAIVGVQGGVDVRHPLARRLDFGLVGKGCLGVNIAKSTLTNTSGPDATGGVGTTNFVVGSGDTSSAVLLDGLAQLIFAPADAIMIRGGYQLLYAQSLVLAPDQLNRTGTALRDFPVTAFPTGLGQGPSHGGSVLLHGAFVGAEVRF